MVRWLVRFAGSVALVAGMLALPGVLSTTTPASADTVVDGCTIVSNPTPTHFTNCPGVGFAGANLSGLNLSYANLGGSVFADCLGVAPPVTCSGADLNSANLTDANLTNIVVAYGVATNCSPFPCSFSAYASFNGANLSGANMSNTAYGDANFSDANLTGANLTGANFDEANTNIGEIAIGATLTGANFTDTTVVPSNQSVTATSQAGAVATWSTPAGIPGATPGTCTPASGSTFPLFSSSVTCQVLDVNGDVATGTFQVNVAPTTQYFTVVGIPSNGAVLAGDVHLDAAAGDAPGVKNVVFEVSGGTITNQVVATAQPTIYGWIGLWNTTSVPNGTYTLQSVATDAAAHTDTSEPVTITVNNQPPSTAVLIPAGGATLSGAKALLDASASSAVGIASVSFEVSGNGLSDQVVATGTPTLYGYLTQWNTTTVPNGTYTLQSVATDTVAETTTSAPVSVTVNNPAPTTAVLIPSTGATQWGPTALLDASASTNVTSVSFEVSGGSLSGDQPIATATPTLYGWLAQWNTNTVPNGSYALQSVACYAGGVCGTSPGITINVLNAATAYVADFTNPGGVTPINTAIKTPGRPIGNVGADPASIVISPDGKTAYVLNFEIGGNITPINLLTGTAGTPITLPPNTGPQAMAITPDGSTGYLVDGSPSSGGGVLPINLVTGTVGTRIPLLTLGPSDIVMSPDGKTAYVSCPFSNPQGTGDVVPIDTATNTAGTPIPAGGPGPAGLAITPDGKTLYVTNYATYDIDFELISYGTTVTPIDTATATAGTPITVGTGPSSVAITPNGATAYVTNSQSGNVTPIDVATNTAGSPITLNTSLAADPFGVAITPDGSTAYVSSENNNEVIPIDTATNTTETPISVSSPLGIAIH